MRNFTVSILFALCLPIISCAQTPPVEEVREIQVEEIRTIDGELLAKAWEYLQQSKEGDFFKNNNLDCYRFRQARFDGKDVIYITGKRLAPQRCSYPPSYNILFDENRNVYLCSSVVEHEAKICLN